MRSIFFLFSLLGVASVAAAASEDPIMCTMQYAPVCGTVQVQCITTPCEPVRQTFGNACMAGAARATDITTGECESTPVVGGDADEHGCKASAGYSWDATLAQCIRVWEKPQTLVTWAHDNALTRYADVSSFGYEHSLTRQEAAAIIARTAEKIWGLRYASYPDNCNVAYSDESVFDTTLKNDIYSACAFDLMHGQGGVFSPTRTLSRAEALAIIMRGVDGGKKDESGARWYEKYLDRAHDLGIISSGSVDFATTISRGELIEWIYKASQYVTTQRELIGTWTLDSYRLDDMMFSGTGILTFDNGRYSAKFCNTTSSNYTVSAGGFIAKNEARTEMACLDGHIMTIEDGWMLDGAQYALDSDVLTITMARGGVYIFSRQITETEVLMGNWKLQKFNSTSISDSQYTLNLTSNSVSAKFCNNVFGSYTLKDGKFVAPVLASTKMYCEGLPMTLEDAFTLDGATYSVVALRLAQGATGPTMLLTITTSKGDVYVYGR